MQPQDQVTVEVTLEPRDFYWPFVRTRLNIFRFFFAILALILALDAWRFWPSQDSIVMAYIAAGLVLICLYPWIKIQYQFRKYPAFRKPRRFTFDAEGMRLQTADADSNYKWSDFTRIAESKRFFLFVRKNGAGRAVPKRFLTQPADIPTLRKLIRENFKGTRRLRID